MKIYSPNREYTGISASVAFCDGRGETDDPHLIEWFKEHGYTVEEPKSHEEESDIQVEKNETQPEESVQTKGKRGKA